MRRLRPGLRRTSERGGEPRLTVVVPVYNVERYLADCLESILAQSFTRLDVVLVDDGGTDGSVAIAERYAREDARIRLVHQANAGLGAARNTGVRVARGDYLTFLDSDDILPPGAYDTMMETIDRTGSDMVVGTLRRDHGDRQSTTRLMAENHRARREGITLADMPLMLADVFAGNKIYRRSFWDAAALSFPEGMRYEDQPTLTRAFVEAKRFDVIPEVVYLWRIRGDGSSITQHRHELADLVDRVESKRMSTALVQQAPQPGLHDVWFRDVLPVDMWEYFRAVPGCTDTYWSELRLAMRQFWSDRTVPFEHTRAPVQQRLMGWLVDHGRRRDLERLISFIDEHGGGLQLEVRDGEMVARPPAEGRAEEPAESVFACAEHERRWVS